MAKGKYAARALNRAASLDNEVIVDLRGQLKAAKDTNAELASELSRMKSEFNSRLIRAVAKETEGERLQLRDQIQSGLAKQTAAMTEAADQIAGVLAEIFGVLYEKYGSEESFVPNVVTNHIDGHEGPSLLRVFNLLDSDRAGVFMDRIMTYNGKYVYPDSQPTAGANRRRKRRSARDIDRDMARHDHERAQQRVVEALKNRSPGDEQET